jgi:hypothetical protein
MDRFLDVWQQNGESFTNWQAALHLYGFTQTGTQKKWGWQSLQQLQTNHGEKKALAWANTLKSRPDPVTGSEEMEMKEYYAPMEDSYSEEDGKGMKMNMTSNAALSLEAGAAAVASAASLPEPLGCGQRRKPKRKAVTGEAGAEASGPTTEAKRKKFSTTKSTWAKKRDEFNQLMLSAQELPFGGEQIAEAMAPTKKKLDTIITKGTKLALQLWTDDIPELAETLVQKWTDLMDSETYTAQLKFARKNVCTAKKLKPDGNGVSVSGGSGAGKAEGEEEAEEALNVKEENGSEPGSGTIGDPDVTVDG